MRKARKPFVTVEYTRADKAGVQENITYDFLINATGPKLNFGATEGLGPDHGHTVSVCTVSHAQEANHKLQASIDAMRKGERQTIVIGTGHGMCTCQGAAFEYIYNVDHVLREAGVRDKARIVWLSNEYELGDFGMGGVHIKRGGYITNGKTFAESLMVERGIEWITRAHVKKVEAGKIHYETMDGTVPRTGIRLLHADSAVRRRRPESLQQGRRGHHQPVVCAQRFHEGGCRLHRSVRIMEWSAKDWPQDLPDAVLSQHLRGRHRVCARRT